MNIKEQIKAEIDKRYKEYRAKMKTDDFTYYEGMADALDLFEQFIDTLPEQPASGDLEQAAQRSAVLHYEMSTDIDKSMKVMEARIFHEIGFKAGAEWQKEQDDELLTIAHLDGVTKGRKAEREQMMKDAVEAEVYGCGDEMTPEIAVELGSDYKPGDKVKVIVIPEEK